MITSDDLKWWLALAPKLDWQVATTFEETAPHEYVVLGKEPKMTQKDFIRAVHVIRTFGSPGKFYKQTRIYLNSPDGFKFWDMQDPLIVEETIKVINRAPANKVYGAQDAPVTYLGISSPFDKYGSSWDLQLGMTEQEKTQLTTYLQKVFPRGLGKTLDIGCGTGVLLDLVNVSAADYFGVEPSRAMLNSLVLKHPQNKNILPMTFLQSVDRDIFQGSKFDSVVALGGTASFLSAADILNMRALAKRNVLLMFDTSDVYKKIRIPFAGNAICTSMLTDPRIWGVVEDYKIGRFTTVVLGPLVKGVVR